MNPRRALARTRLPLCVAAAFGAHGLAAAALPTHAHRAALALLADASFTPVEMETQKEKEKETAPATVAGDPPTTERAAPVAAPAAALPPRTNAAPALAKEVIANPEDSASESTEPAAGGGGWDDGDGANGAGRGTLGGRGANGTGGHDHAPARHMRTHHASAKASLEAGRDWSDCPFPKDARRRTAFVRISVVVDAKGEAIDVKLLNDPGEGFGDSAKVCAKRRHYVAGRNDAGEKDATETEPFLVYFTR